MISKVLSDGKKDKKNFKLTIDKCKPSGCSLTNQCTIGFPSQKLEGSYSRVGLGSLEDFKYCY